MLRYVPEGNTTFIRQVFNALYDLTTRKLLLSATAANYLKNLRALQINLQMQAYFIHLNIVLSRSL